MTRRTVENTSFLDIQQFLELDHGEDYTINEVSGKKFFVTAEKDHCYIDTLRINYATTRNGYGHRKWFICPVCRRNTKRLYLPRNELAWACRKCHQLTYTKSQLSGNEFAYVTRRIYELQDELEVTKDNSYSVLGLTAAMIERAPIFKPKYMSEHKFWVKRTLLELLILKRYELWAKRAKM